jgi:hypothetical protein
MCSTGLLTEVVSNDSHGVVIDAELLDTLGTGVDQPEAVLLAVREFELGDTSVWRARQCCVLARVVHLPVDQIVINLWNLVVHRVIDQGEVILMVPYN